MPEIALFGGSFDPPHVGHLLAAAYVLATEPVDELWFVPVLQHPLDKPLVAPYEHRVALLERLAADLHRARVSRAEQESGEGRTVDLLEWLHRKHPDTRWALVLGTDLDGLADADAGMTIAVAGTSVFDPRAPVGQNVGALRAACGFHGST